MRLVENGPSRSRAGLYTEGQDPLAAGSRRAAESVAAPPVAKAAPLALCCLIAAFCSLDRVVMGVAILPMAADLGFDETTKGAVAAAFSLGYGASIVPSGALVSKTGRPRRALGFGLLGWSLAQAATAPAALLNLPALLGARAAMGAGEATCLPSLQVIAATDVEEGTRSRFWGALTASLQLGTISAYAVTPAIIENFGWPAAFYAFGGAGALLSAAWLTTAAPGEAATAAPEEAELPWRRLLCKPVAALGVAHAASNVFLYFAIYWLPTFFVDVFGDDASAASSASLLPFAAGAVAAVAAGAAADGLAARVGLTRTRKIAQSVGTLGPVVALIALATLEDAGALGQTAAEGLLAFAVASHAVTCAGHGVGIQDIARRDASLVYGATTVLAVCAGAGGQYATGVALDATGGDFAPVFLAIGATQVVGLAAWWAGWDSEHVGFE